MLITRLQDLAQQQFTGVIDVESTKSKQINQWKIYLCVGKLIWANSNIHSVRALHRQVKKYCPQVDLNKINFSAYKKCPCKEYSFFSALLQQRTIEQNQFNDIVINQIQEILFDILQKESTESISINYEEISASSLLDYGFKISNAVFDVNLIIKEAQQSWLMWIKNDLKSISPNDSPIIVNANKLQQVVSPTVYKNFSSCLNGQYSFRDLAVILNKDLLHLTLSLMPYIKKQLAKFIEIKDLNLEQKTSVDNNPLIACIDDSPQVIYIMNQIVTQANYRFLGIQEAIKAIPNLIGNMPDLIFLDIGMPILNGYEICSQIQRVSKLQGVPIVMLTGNDGLVDRVRAKLVGADDFVAKPIETEVIIKTINKFILSKSKYPEDIIMANL